MSVSLQSRRDGNQQHQIRAALMRALAIQSNASLAGYRPDGVAGDAERSSDPAVIIHCPVALDLLMADPFSRDACYHEALAVAAEDQTRRTALARLLLVYMIGFPPAEKVLNHVVAMCVRAVSGAAAGDDRETYEQLQQLAQSYLDRPPLCIVVTRVPAAAYVTDRPGAPQYTLLPPFQPLSREMKRSRRRINFPVLFADDAARLLRDKNISFVTQPSDTDKEKTTDDNFQTMDNDGEPYSGGRYQYYYSGQKALSISSSLLLKQVTVLCNYHVGYNSNPVVLRATNIIVKLLCDAFCRKLLLVQTSPEADGSISYHYPFLREATVAFISIFLRMLGSEYSCVREHVYDMMLTIALHLQLVLCARTSSEAADLLEDRARHNRVVEETALASALTGELCWLLSRLVERQVRLVNADESLWQASLKCCLMVMPRDWLCTLDPRALVTWMRLRGLAVMHPHIYTVLAKALCGRLFGVVVMGDTLDTEGADEAARQPEPNSSEKGRVASRAARKGPTSEDESINQSIHGNGNPYSAAEPQQTSASLSLSPASAPVPDLVKILCRHTSLILAERTLILMLSTGEALAEVLDLYDIAVTVGARLSLFCVLFGVAAARCGFGVRGPEIASTNGDRRKAADDRSVLSSPTTAGSPIIVDTMPQEHTMPLFPLPVPMTGLEPQGGQQVLASVLVVLVQLCFDWHYHTLFDHQSHDLTRDLPQSILLSLGKLAPPTHALSDVRAALQHVLLALLELSASHRKLPPALASMLFRLQDTTENTVDSDEVNNRNTFVTLNQVGRECCQMLPDLMTGGDGSGTAGSLSAVLAPTENVLRRTASRLVYHLLRVLRSPQFERHYGEDDASQRLLQTVASHPSTCVRALAADILGSLVALCRTNPHQGTSLSELLRLSLGFERHVPHLLEIYYVLIESLTAQAAPLLAGSADIAILCMRGRMHLLQRAAELLGPAVFWQLYWGLRGSQLAAARRARFVLLSILTALEQRGPPRHQIPLWAKAMTDPAPAATLVAAQQVVRIASVHYHDVYKAAITTLLLRRKLSLRRLRDPAFTDSLECQTDDRPESMGPDGSSEPEVPQGGQPPHQLQQGLAAYDLAIIIWWTLQTEDGGFSR